MNRTTRRGIQTSTRPTLTRNCLLDRSSNSTYLATVTQPHISDKASAGEARCTLFANAHYTTTGGDTSETGTYNTKKRVETGIAEVQTPRTRGWQREESMPGIRDRRNLRLQTRVRHALRRKHWSTIRRSCRQSQSLSGRNLNRRPAVSRSASKTSVG